MINRQGFTLIELLIVIAIMALLAALAYPSYQSHLIQSRRGDAKTELLKAQLQQSSRHILNAYSSVEASIGLPTNHEYYTFSIVSAGVNTYLMKAVAKNGTTQAKDKIACRTLFIDQSSRHTSDGSINNDQCW